MMVFGVVFFSIISGSIASIMDHADDLDEEEQK
jgi:hypothetical protein